MVTRRHLDYFWGSLGKQKRGSRKVDAGGLLGKRRLLIDRVDLEQQRKGNVTGRSYNALSRFRIEVQ